MRLPPPTKRVVLVAAYFLLLHAPLLVCQQLDQDGAQKTQNRTSDTTRVCEPSVLGSPFIPVDNWIYPAVWRLYAMGYVDNVFLGVRPWTRASIEPMLEEAKKRIDEAEADAADQPTVAEALKIYEAINRELLPDMEGPCGAAQGEARLESVYSISRIISGTPLRDSYHLGSTIINDYGRPYEHGYNNYSGVSGYATVGRWTFYARTEFQGAPSAAGYSPALYQELSAIDGTVNPVTGLAYPDQTTIPGGPISVASNGRFLEAYVSFQYLNHVFSIGKEDEWLGPAQGASFAYSNNAENIYAFHVDRIEPLYVPLLSRLTGPFRYEFLVGQLRGHTLMPNPLYSAGAPSQPNVIAPGNPWVHVEKLNFRPTKNLEMGFERTVIWGGQGHEPITLHTFLKSFFSFQNVPVSEKYGPGDPGARFGSVDLSYRLPFLRRWLTFYADGEVHDDVSPIDAPRRAAWRPGLYLSHVPGMPKMDIRFEAAMTDPSISNSQGGHFMYYETIQRQGYTNQGQIFGDWIGREDKGGQAWITYHISGNEQMQICARNQKAAKDFIPGGSTLNDLSFQWIKRIGKRKDFQVNANLTLENWRAPIYLAGQQTVTATSVQLTWFPRRKLSF